MSRIMPIIVGALIGVILVGTVLGIAGRREPTATPEPAAAPWPERELESLAAKCGQSPDAVAGGLLVVRRHFRQAGRTGSDYELAALARAMDRTLPADGLRMSCKEFLAVWIAEADALQGGTRR